MAPTLTVCLIMKNEEQVLGGCLSSIENYVDDIIIVDTGSTDNSKEIAAKHEAVIYDCTPQTHPQYFIKDDESTGAPGPFTGEMILANFAGARNVGWDKATTDYVMWMDADDVIVGGKQLAKLLARMTNEDVSYGALRYTYGFDDQGKPTMHQWRERIIKRGAGRWSGLIHETVDTNNVKAKRYTGITVEHRRQTKAESNLKYRNYKVLRHSLRLEGATPSPRTLFYLGNEAQWFNTSEAAAHWERYLRLSKWGEERSVALVGLGRIWEQVGSYEQALRCYAAAMVEDPQSPDGWFGMARVAYFRERWAECCQWTEEGLAIGNPDSALWHNPIARLGEPHTYYNVALSKMGRVKDAIKSCQNGLAVEPDNKYLANNLKLYESALP